MNKTSSLIPIACCLMVSCASHTERKPSATVPNDLSSNTYAMASGQSIPCTFDAEVIRIAPGKAASRGYVIHDDPIWVVELNVLSHDQKTPFQPGRRECYIADIQTVFGSPPEAVSGVYRFSYTWNVDVPGKSKFQNFKAKKRLQ